MQPHIPTFNKMFEGCFHIPSSQPRAEDALQQQQERQDPCSHLPDTLTGKYRKAPMRLERGRGMQKMMDRWWFEVKVIFSTCRNHQGKEKSEPRNLWIWPAESLLRRADMVASAVSQWGGTDMNWEHIHVPEWDITHAMVGFTWHENWSHWRAWKRDWRQQKKIQLSVSHFPGEVLRSCLQL